MNEKEFYTLQEISGILRITYRTVYNWIFYNTQKLLNFPRPYKFGGNWRVKKSEFDNWIKEQKKEK